jgi:hypothetical protein
MCIVAVWLALKLFVIENCGGSVSNATVSITWHFFKQLDCPLLKEDTVT